MVQIRVAKNGEYELTDRSRTITLAGGKIKLEDQAFDEPGEYEVEGVEIVYGTQAALLVWEKLQIAYIFSADKPTSFEKSQFSPCNILLIDPAISTLDKPKTNELLETYDPNVVVFCFQTPIEEIQGALKIEDRDILKLTEATLPLEGRELYRLTE
ncbi:MAG: hypothetical protein HZB70_02275 [Candidatus Berkelbacteria bacterium]|nr:MAG: hypothetical protein HZB70_02275 [Candidatus Berkelbacteria bacterium]QQG51858.1 MAG: hypothetical protein HY845_00720 [Candidatus Berkelbacteria bacterium]